MLLQKLNSLSIFFPFYNEEGSVQRMIESAYEIGSSVADDLEVIALHGGNSKDRTFEKIMDMKNKYPDLVIVDKRDNWEGYAVIKYGFQVATKEWIFYTDGDAQYRLDGDLLALVAKHFEMDADVVNGYKKERRDNFIRTFLGKIYARLSRFLFNLPIRDTDCDFRLIRKSFLDKITLESHDASILPELVKKLQFAGAKFAEVPVNHYKREYGISSYALFSLLKEKLIGDIQLFFKLRKWYKKQNGLRS